MYWDEIKTNEMSIRQLMKMSIKIFKENAKAIILVTFIIFIPINIANSLIPFNGVMDNLSSILLESGNIDYTLLDFTAVQQNLSELIKWMTISVILQQFFGCLALMGVSFIVYEFIQGNRLDYKFALEESFGRWIPAIWTLFLSVFIMMGLSLFMFIPAFIFSVYTNFMLYIVMIKKQKGTAALSYSFKIVRNRFWKTLGKLLIIFILQYVASFVVISAFSYLPTNTVADFIISCLNTFITIFFWIVQTIWFLNYDSVEPGKKNAR